MQIDTVQIWSPETEAGSFRYGTKICFD